VTFQRAYDRLQAAQATYDRASRLHVRVVTRYRLFGRDPTPGVDALWEKLAARRAIVEDLLGEAQFQLDRLWDRASRALDPSADHSEAYALPRTVAAQEGETPAWFGAIAIVLHTWNRLGWNQW
jgi:hypothetical protein